MSKQSSENCKKFEFHLAWSFTPMFIGFRPVLFWKVTRH